MTEQFPAITDGQEPPRWRAVNMLPLSALIVFADERLVEATMQWLWTWGGVSFGYREGDNLWTHDGRHVGRFHGIEVYAPTAAISANYAPLPGA
jgi:hypothetical protein